MSIEDDLTRAEHLRDTARIALEEALSLYEAEEGRRTMELAMTSPKPTRDMILAQISIDKIEEESRLYESWRTLMRSKALAWRAGSRYEHLKRCYFDHAKGYA